MEVKPTKEQRAILDAFEGDADIIIEAGAGTGKTTTLRMMAESQPEYTGLYVCFNKGVAQEASALFPRTVRCRTVHSLAYGYMMRSSRNQKLIGKLGSGFTNMDTLSKLMFGSAEPFIEVPNGSNGTEVYGTSKLALLGLRVIRGFCQSADETITLQHFYRPKEIERAAWREAKELLGGSVVGAAVKAWADLIDPTRNVVRFTHDHYLKLWQLSHPTLDWGYILLDEAQDCSPVMSDVLLRQRVQRVAVGDPRQQLYAFTGAIDAMGELAASSPDHVRLRLTESWRFGPEIAQVANNVLTALSTDMRLSGMAASSEVHVEEPEGAPPVSAVLVRTNSGGIAEALKCVEQELQPYMNVDVGYLLEFCKGAHVLKMGRRTTQADLAKFPTWGAFVKWMSESEEGQSEYGLITGLIEEHGSARLIELLERMELIEPQEADLVISTVHKAKGLEWDRVRVGADFTDVTLDQNELMVLYVALTRAKRGVVTGPSWPLTKYGVPCTSAWLMRLLTKTSLELDSLTPESIEYIRGEFADLLPVPLPESADLVGAVTELSQRNPEPFKAFVPAPPVDGGTPLVLEGARVVEMGS